MTQDVLSIIRSLFNSKSFAQFVDGVRVTLPNGERVILKLESLKQALPQKFTSQNYVYNAVVTGGGYREIGQAEDSFRLLAMQKSISEAVERIIYRTLKGSKYGTSTSNGWAAHLSRPKAEQAALFELLERDAVLVHWLSKTPFLVVEYDSLPKTVKKWAKEYLSESTFPHLTVLVSTLGHVPTVSTVFFDKGGSGVVSHCASFALDKALERALAETRSIARIAYSNKFAHSSLDMLSEDEVLITGLGPYEQAVTYAHHLSFPNWIFGKTISWKEAQRVWAAHQKKFKKNPVPYTFTEITSSPLCVGYCSSSQVQPLYFGRTVDAKKNGILNLERLKAFGTEENLNWLPHFVA